MKRLRVAVIGSGLSGLITGNLLKNIADVTLFEKSRYPGGRISTRNEISYSFDHGAQFFTARTVEFKEFITPLIFRRIIQVWEADFVEIKDREIFRRSKSWLVSRVRCDFKVL